MSSLNERVRDFLLTDDPTINDKSYPEIQMRWLGNQGYAGTLPDRWQGYFVANGYGSQQPEAWLQWLKDNGLKT